MKKLIAFIKAVPSELSASPKEGVQQVRMAYFGEIERWVFSLRGKYPVSII